MELISVDGAELEYEISGSGEPVVFIHGALIADTFRLLLAESSLAGRYRFIIYHRRGYAGSSRSSGPATIERQAADCTALLRHLGVERAHVAGHSYGGTIALQLALDTPAMVYSLALLEPALMTGASAADYRTSLTRGVDRYREVETSVVVNEFLEARWPGYRETLDHVLPGAFAQAVTDANTFYECEVSGLLDWSFTEAAARRISQPTLCVVGGESLRLARFRETHRHLLNLLPHAEGFVLPGAMHFLQVQNPRGIAGALAEFWAQHPVTD